MLSSVQSLGRVWLFVTPWTTALQASLSIINSQSPPKTMSIKSVMPSSHLILCHPLLLLPSIFPSIRLISNQSALRIRWSKYCSFSFNISPSNEHPGLLSFRMDWLDLLAVQGTLKSLQKHSSKASILLCSTFHTQLSYPYTTTGKTIALTGRTFVFVFFFREKGFIYFFNLAFFFFFCSDFVIHWNETAWVYMCSPSRSPLPPPSPPDPSRSSQCTRSERLSHASNLGWWSVSP